jgi:hypothetical protein
MSSNSINGFRKSQMSKSPAERARHRAAALARSPWTPEKIAQLTELADAGRTAQEIGEVFGVSRQTARIKATRIGLNLKQGKRGSPQGRKNSKETIARMSDAQHCWRELRKWPSLARG